MKNNYICSIICMFCERRIKMIDFINNNKWIYNVMYSLLVVLIAILFYLIVSRIFLKKLESKQYKVLTSRNSSTYIKLFKSMIHFYFNCNIYITKN